MHNDSPFAYSNTVLVMMVTVTQCTDVAALGCWHAGSRRAVYTEGTKYSGSKPTRTTRCLQDGLPQHSFHVSAPYAHHQPGDVNLHACHYWGTEFCHALLTLLCAMHILAMHDARRIGLSGVFAQTQKSAAI